jgi:NAD(P)H-dependent FMN reductase
MTQAPKLGFICGSTRAGSINQQLKKALMRLAKAEGARTTDINLESFGLPLFHGDLARPAGVKKLISKMKGCEAIIVVTPEYNGGLPPLLKNAIDWVSTVETGQFTGPVYGIASCTPGPMSGIMCMRQLNYILMRVGAEVVPAQVGTGGGGSAFDAKGKLIAQPSAKLADKMLNQILTRCAQKSK